MRTRKDVPFLLVVVALAAAGCAGQSNASGQQGAASTQAPPSIATGTTERATPVPPTETAVPTNTTAPQQATNAGVNDYGYGAGDYGYGAAATPTTGQGPSTGGPSTVGTAMSSLGLILVDSRGHTIYALTMDSPGVSTCLGNCLENWPPLSSDGTPLAGDGVQPALLGVMRRGDGGTQVTYDGKPLYTYANDQAAGDLNGQGKGGVWFAVKADGGYAR